MEDTSFFFLLLLIASLIHLWTSVFGVEFIYFHWAYLNRTPGSIYCKNTQLKKNTAWVHFRCFRIPLLSSDCSLQKGYKL